jgi:hypothetical protein
VAEREGFEPPLHCPMLETNVSAKSAAPSTAIPVAHRKKAV